MVSLMANLEFNGAVTFDDVKITNKSIISAHVNAADSYGCYVENNGEKVYESTPRAAGEYDVDIPLKNDGENNIVFYLVDIYKNMYSFTKTVIRDTVAPKLSLAEDYGNIETFDEVLTIHGTVADYDNLLLNNNPVSVTAYETFSYDVTLHIGDNGIYLAAMDAAGNETAYDLHITRFEKPKQTTPWTSYIAPVMIGIGLVVLAVISIKKRKNCGGLAKTDKRKAD